MPAATAITKSDFRSYAAAYARDGVVVVRGALDEREMALVERAFDHVLRHPDTAFFPLNPDDAGQTIEAPGYSIDDPVFQDVMAHTDIGRMASEVMGGGAVWYVGEQLWFKRGPAQRTIWHQDSAFEPYTGAKNAVLWIPLESLASENVLEVVCGSHAGATYNATYATGKDNEVAGMYDAAVWPAPLVPDIEAARGQWGIFSAGMTRGDVLVFHENALHGGAPVAAGQVRRTLSFRLAGDDVVYAPRPRTRMKDIDDYVRRTQGERFHQAFEGLAPGDPLGRGPHMRRVFG